MNGCQFCTCSYIGYKDQLQHLYANPSDSHPFFNRKITTFLLGLTLTSTGKYWVTSSTASSPLTWLSSFPTRHAWPTYSKTVLSRGTCQITGTEICNEFFFYKKSLKKLFFMRNRLLAQSVSMTGADLNSSSKPWFVQEMTSKVVYEEFHEQVNETRSSLYCKDVNETRASFYVLWYCKDIKPSDLAHDF